MPIKSNVYGDFYENTNKKPITEKTGVVLERELKQKELEYAKMKREQMKNYIYPYGTSSPMTTNQNKMLVGKTSVLQKAATVINYVQVLEFPQYRSCQILWNQ